MKSEQAVERMRDLEKLYLSYMDAGAEGLGWEAVKEAKNIYEEIVYDGCGEKYFDEEDKEHRICKNFYCPNCQEIKEIAIRFDAGFVHNTNNGGDQ